MATNVTATLLAFLADAAAQRVTDSVPGTTSYRAAVADAVAESLATSLADAELAKSLAAALTRAVDTR